MLRSILILVLSAMIMPGACWSSEEKADDEDVFTLDEIIVSATKTAETRRDISNSVIVVDEDDIEGSAARTIGDLLGNEQGIDLRTYGDYGGASEEIHIRGMGADGTQILLNGISLNTPSLGRADAAKISLNNIERIEVVKGAGSLLYGTGAMAGTINIITKRPQEDAAALKIGAGYGTNSAYEMSAEQGMFLTGSVGYYLSATRKETDGFRSNSALDHKDISINIVYDSEDGPDISLYGDYLDRDYGLPGVKTPDGASEFSANGIKLYDNESSNLLNEGGDEDVYLAFDISGSPIDMLKLDLKATYTNMENYNKYIYYYYGFSGSKTWVANRVKGIEGDADIEPLKGMKILVGGEYKRYDWENRGITLDGNGLDMDGTGTSAAEGLDTFGLFTEVQYRPVECLKMIAGVRRERHSEFGARYIYRYGMIITPFKDTFFKVNYGEHYNAPTPNDLFWPYEDWGWGMGTSGNRNLKPETGRHADAIIEKGFLNDKLFVNVAWFKWDIKDKIRWVPDAFYFYTPQNLYTYRSEGWEMGASIGPLFDTTLSLSYTYTDAEEELRGGICRQAWYTAKDYFKADLNYEDRAGLSLTATFRYIGDRPGYFSLDTDTVPDVVLPSYGTVDVRIEQSPFKNWILSLKCNNLFDREYDTYTSSFTDQTTGISSIERYPGAGRSVFFNISYKY
jgi:outer membrane cobalamin receptor